MAVEAPANRFDYVGAAPVQWWRLDGAGHSVVSQKVLIPVSDANGSQNHDIEFAEVAWAFFRSLLPDGRTAAPAGYFFSGLGAMERAK
jgi:poly(3-hydroxybutyrate) depolymerase